MHVSAEPIRDRNALILGTMRIASLVVLAIGLILVIGATPGTGSTSWPADLAGAGAGLPAAGLASLVALLGIKTYQDQRREAAEAATLQARSRVYEEIVAHIVRSFLGGNPPQSDAVVRSQAAMWASPSTLQALADWYRFASEQSGKQTNLGERAPQFELVYRVVAAMREDLYPGSGTTKDHVLRMIFNDYFPAMHNPDSVRALKVLEDGRTDWKPRPWNDLDNLSEDTSSP